MMVRRRTVFLAHLALVGVLAALAAPLVTLAARPARQQAPIARPSPQQAPAVQPTPQQVGDGWPLVAWTPIPDNPVFAGTARDTWDRKIRERGYILPGDDGTLHLWYTGYAGDRPATMSLGHATSPDGVHWTRDPENPIFSGSWVEDMCVVRHDGTYFMFAEGKNDIAHLLTSADGRKWTDHGTLDIRKTDGSPIEPRTVRHPYGLVRERHLVPLLRARRPGSLAGDLERSESLDQRPG